MFRIHDHYTISPIHAVTTSSPMADQPIATNPTVLEALQTLLQSHTTAPHTSPYNHPFAPTFQPFDFKGKRKASSPEETEATYQQLSNLNGREWLVSGADGREKFTRGLRESSVAPFPHLDKRSLLLSRCLAYATTLNG